jgi:Cys-rich repeat protein
VIGGPRARRLAVGLVLAVALSAAGCRVTLHFAANDGGAPPAAACADDQDCPLPSLHCEAASGNCYQCVSDTDCSKVSGHPRCDTSKHICVQCGLTADCPAGLRCAGETCVQGCSSNSDCATIAGTSCDDDDGICAQCDEGRGCSGATPYCAVNHQCVACVSNGQCAGPTPICNTTAGRCVACLTSGDCGSGAVCDPADWICEMPPP